MTQLSQKLSEPKPPSSKHFLKPYEWLAILAFVGWLFVLVMMTNISAHTSIQIAETHHLISPEIEVNIEGAVNYPGKYRLKRGSLLKDLLALAQPTSTADLRRIKGESKLRDGRSIRIPEKKKRGRN